MKSYSETQAALDDKETQLYAQHAASLLLAYWLIDCLVYDIIGQPDRKKPIYFVPAVSRCVH